MYMCEALNAAGRDQKLVQLSVLGMSCLSPHLYCPDSFNQPSRPQAGEGQPALGEPGMPCALCCSGIWGAWWLRS